MAEAKRNFEPVRLKVPASADDIAGLKLGSVVYLDGLVYTGREGVYQKIIAEGAALPLDLPATSNVNFHCSPAAAREPDGSYSVGGVTATASFRCNNCSPRAAATRRYRARSSTRSWTAPAIPA